MGLKVPPIWDVSISFTSSRGRRISARVESYGHDFTDAMDNIDDADLEAAGLNSDAHPDLQPDETLVAVTLDARRR